MIIWNKSALVPELCGLEMDQSCVSGHGTIQLQLLFSEGSNVAGRLDVENIFSGYKTRYLTYSLLFSMYPTGVLFFLTLIKVKEHLLTRIITQDPITTDIYLYLVFWQCQPFGVGGWGYLFKVHYLHFPVWSASCTFKVYPFTQQVFGQLSRLIGVWMSNQARLRQLE